MSAYPSWALICAILGCIGAVVLLAWNTAQEHTAATAMLRQKIASYQD